MVLEGSWFAGSVSVHVAGGGDVSLVNVLALDCSVCKETDELASLDWLALPLGPKLDLFCACELASRGVTFRSYEAKLSASLTIASSFDAASSTARSPSTRLCSARGQGEERLGGSAADDLRDRRTAA